MKYNAKKISRNILLLEMALGYAKTAQMFDEMGAHNSASKFQEKHIDYMTDIVFENTKPEVVHEAVLVGEDTTMDTVMGKWEKRAQKLKNVRLRPVHFTNGFRITPDFIVQDLSMEDQPVIVVSCVEPVTHV